MYRSLLLAAILAAGALSHSANACGIGAAPDEDPKQIEKPQKTSEPTSPDAANVGVATRPRLGRELHSRKKRFVPM
jgi:hypothetical protein